MKTARFTLCVMERKDGSTFEVVDPVGCDNPKSENLCINEECIVKSSKTIELYEDEIYALEEHGLL